MALSLAGCSYESHPAQEALGSVDGGVPAVDAGTADPPDPSGAGGDISRPAHLQHGEVAVQATIRAWRERHLIHGDVSSPDSERCFAEIPDLETVTVSPEEFRRLCQKCVPDDPASECDELGRANACAPFDRLRQPDGELGESRALNVIAPAFPAGSGVHRRLVIHETIHHLGRCSGEGLDHWHQESHWWCTGGDVCEPGEAAESINSRARVFAGGDDE